MLLVIDIGNTNAVLGLYAGEALQHHFRVESSKSRTSDEYAVALRALLAMKGVAPADVRASAIACVVPALQEADRDSNAVPNGRRARSGAVAPRAS